MIDPTKITRYDQTPAQLEETILFWILAAGKNGTRAARCLEELLSDIKGHARPFKTLLKYSLPQLLEKHKTGTHNLKAQTILDLINAGFDLRRCRREELTAIKGIGPKTASCFVLHSRRGEKISGLDTHILKFLKAKGYPVKAATPGRWSTYLRWEAYFLAECGLAGLEPAVYDLQIWNKYKVAG